MLNKVFFFENPIFYEIMLKILYARAGHMCIVFWMPKSTNTSTQNI